MSSSRESERPRPASSRSVTSGRRKDYVRPTLVKGPVLASVTAQQLPVVPISQACWVARAAFGESDIRWMIFRAWLLEDAPAWFRHGYLCYGEAIGSWLAGRRYVRAFVRATMLPAIRRKVAG